MPIDPTDYNRADGFSPGNMIITKVPGLETPGGVRRRPARCRSPTSARYDDPDQPVVVIDADTGERQPIWAEIDSNPISTRRRRRRDRPRTSTC